MTPSTKIPKYIHQIWLLGCDKIPHKYKENIASIHKFSKLSSDNWIYKCWNENELYDQCLQHSQYCANLFKSYKSLRDKKKLGKYVILYNFGGIYFDMNCSLLKPLDTIPGLNSKDFIISFSPREYLKNLIFERTFTKILNTATILSSAKNIYIKEIISNIFKNKIRHESLLVTKTLTPYKNDQNILLLNHKYFDPCYSLDSCCIIDKKAIVNHKHELPWMNSYIAWLLGCIFHLKEDYDHLMSSLFLLLLIVIIIMQLFVK